MIFLGFECGPALTATRPKILKCSQGMLVGPRNLATFLTNFSTSDNSENTYLYVASCMRVWCWIQSDLHTAPMRKMHHFTSIAPAYNVIDAKEKFIKSKLIAIWTLVLYDR